eukprot:TRINITY_DN3719_c0_g2_i1.p1 TRINITY_DN3719_c0_g2~~TRINITY_DN3719_c0_g2_i1.p1  ORF type:complete len:298 (+),score=48.64 TRINITY_DN3719_c0_g2_i1:212-1105(+)
MTCYLHLPLESPNMPSSLLSANPSFFTSISSKKPHELLWNLRITRNPDRIPNGFLRFSISDQIHRSSSSRLIRFCSMEQTPKPQEAEVEVEAENRVASGRDEVEERFNVEIRNPNPNFAAYVREPKLSLADQAFFLLAFIACTTSIAFTSLVIAAVPTLYAMGRAAISLSKLADTAREELPSTMAAIRLSGMEISDLTLELSDLSQEIADGVNKSAQAVQAAEAGIRQMGALARHRTISMIQERASLPIISLQPVVAGAARKTSRAVGQATKTFMNIISRGEFSSEDDENGSDRVEI